MNHFQSDTQRVSEAQREREGGEPKSVGGWKIRQKP